MKGNTFPNSSFDLSKICGLDVDLERNGKNPKSLKNPLLSNCLSLALWWKIKWVVWELMTHINSALVDLSQKTLHYFSYFSYSHYYIISFHFKPYFPRSHWLWRKNLDICPRSNDQYSCLTRSFCSKPSLINQVRHCASYRRTHSSFQKKKSYRKIFLK